MSEEIQWGAMYAPVSFNYINFKLERENHASLSTASKCSAFLASQVAATDIVYESYFSALSNYAVTQYGLTMLRGKMDTTSTPIFALRNIPPAPVLEFTCTINTYSTKTGRFLGFFAVGKGRQPLCLLGQRQFGNDYTYEYTCKPLASMTKPAEASRVVPIPDTRAISVDTSLFDTFLSWITGLESYDILYVSARYDMNGNNISPSYLWSFDIKLPLNPV